MEDKGKNSWPGEFGNWNRWDNDRGTLNLITPDEVIRAAALVKMGRVVPCARPLSPLDPPYYPATADSTYKHEMCTAWKSNSGGDVQAASDQFFVQTHGMTVTHIDALNHIGWRGKAFNGVPFDEVASMDGCMRYDPTEDLAIVTRGVLADVPRSRGIEYLEHGDPVTAEDVERCAPDLEPGDALIVRTGHWIAPPRKPKPEEGRYGRLSGMHEDSISLLAERDVAVLATDAGGDNFPPTTTACPLPIHVKVETYLGMHMLHNLDLEELARICAENGRNKFLFVVSALNMPGSTGSPVTPVAVL